MKKKMHGQPQKIIFMAELYRNFSKDHNPDLEYNTGVYGIQVRIMADNGSYRKDLVEFLFRSFQHNDRDPKFTSPLQPEWRVGEPINSWECTTEIAKGLGLSLMTYAEDLKVIASILEAIGKTRNTREAMDQHAKDGYCDATALLKGIAAVGIEQMYYDREIQDYLTIPAGKYKIEQRN